MQNKNEILSSAEQWLSTHRQEMLRDLCDMVACPSVSRADLAVPGAPFGADDSNMLEKALLCAAAHGFQVKNGDGYYGTAIYGDDENAIGIIAHLDVVPAGPNWIRKPFEPSLEGDFLFGRGSGDNKGSAVMALYVMRMIRELDIKLRHGVRLIFGMSEETGMQDMPVYNQREIPCKVTLVPDAAYPVCYAQKGSLTGHVSIALSGNVLSFIGGEADNMVPPTAECILKASVSDVKEALARAGFSTPAFDVEAATEGALVRAHGAAAHAASPQSGRSAIFMLSDALYASGVADEAGRKVLYAIRELSQGYFGEHMNIACEDAATGKTTMVVGIARVEKGKVCLHIDCRLSVASNIPEVCIAMGEACRKLGFDVDLISTTEPSFMAEDDARVQALMKVYRDFTGDDRPAYTMGGGTYSRCVKDAITFGVSFPGEKVRPEGLPEGHGGAHGPDEFVHIPSLMKSALIYLAAILELDEIV